MTAYNVISPSALAAGQPEDISVVLANLQAIAGVLNGGIDNANINAAAAISASKLAGYPSDVLKYLRGDGTWLAAPTVVVGDELAYTERTSDFAITTAMLSSATAGVVVSTPTTAFDGTTPVIVDAYIPTSILAGSPSAQLVLSLWDGTTDLGLAQTDVAAWRQGPLTISRRFTPAAGSRVLSLKVHATVATTGTLSAQTGSPGTYQPIFIRVRRVSPIPPSVAAGSFTAVYYGTTFPVSPADGQEAILVDSVTSPTYQWRFRYNAGSSSPYKWEFIGGHPKLARLGMEQSSTAGSWIDLSTVGPRFTIPNAGDYRIDFGSNIQSTTGQTQQGISICIATGAPLLAVYGQGGSNNYNSLYSTGVLTLAVGNDLRMRYFLPSAGTGSWHDRQILVTPVRIA